jgi:hypothetical protein
VCERGVSMQRGLVTLRVAGAMEWRARCSNARFEEITRDAGLLLGLRRSRWVTTVNFGNQEGEFHKIQTRNT